eukprot:755192-Hanusia_phi.AAC.3
MPRLCRREEEEEEEATVVIDSDSEEEIRNNRKRRQNARRIVENDENEVCNEMQRPQRLQKTGKRNSGKGRQRTLVFSSGGRATEDFVRPGEWIQISFPGIAVIS